MNEPDFEVRLLSEYKPEDLELLLRAVQLSQSQAKEFGRDDDADALDIWCYRIREAIDLAEQLL